jgi:threonine dehydratase
MFTSDLIIETNDLIKPYINTPKLDKSIYLSTDKLEVYFKNEGLQHTKSFKLRGALSKLLRLTEDEKKRGIVAISSGNHGIAVSYACRLLKINNVTIFVPKNTPTSKTEKIEYYGAKLIIDGDTYDEAHHIGMSYVEKFGMTYVDAYDKDPYIYAGQGTIGFEILNEIPEIDSILVPIGGGGLITGIGTIAKAINPSIKIIGVQTEACPAMKASMDENILYAEYESKPSVCEALIGGIGHLAFERSKTIIDDILIVKEDTIKKAVKHMIIKEKIIAEPSSCTVIAALMDYPEYDFGKQVVLVLSGSNIDEKLMMEILENNKNKEY